MAYINQEGVEFTADQLTELAKTEPLKWLKIFMDENGFDESNADEFDGSDFEGIKMIEVYSEGGHEGGGEHAELVFAVAPIGSVVKAGRVEGALAYIRATGYYASNEGTEWDDDYEIVEPRDVMVVQYHPKGNA